MKKKLGIHDIRNAARFAQNVLVQYESYQVNIRRATNTDSWGPTTAHLNQILHDRNSVSMLKIANYVLKRLMDHISIKPKNFYEKARKDFINYGTEWRVVFKSLIVLEFLLLNVDDGIQLDELKQAISAQENLLRHDVELLYHIRSSNDNKVGIHERSIKTKCRDVLTLLESGDMLTKERQKTKEHMEKMSKLGDHEQSNRIVSSTNIAFNANDIDLELDSEEEGKEEEEHISNENQNNDDTEDNWKWDVESESKDTKKPIELPTTSNKFHFEDANNDVFDNPFAKEDGRSRHQSIIQEQRRQRRETLRSSIVQSEDDRRKRQDSLDNENNYSAWGPSNEDILKNITADAVEKTIKEDTSKDNEKEETKTKEQEQEEADDDFGEFSSSKNDNKISSSSLKEKLEQENKKTLNESNIPFADKPKEKEIEKNESLNSEKDTKEVTVEKEDGKKSQENDLFDSFFNSTGSSSSKINSNSNANTDILNNNNSVSSNTNNNEKTENIAKDLIEDLLNFDDVEPPKTGETTLTNPISGIETADTSTQETSKEVFPESLI